MLKTKKTMDNIQLTVQQKADIISMYIGQEASALNGTNKEIYGRIKGRLYSYNDNFAIEVEEDAVYIIDLEFDTLQPLLLNIDNISAEDCMNLSIMAGIKENDYGKEAAVSTGKTIANAIRKDLSSFYDLTATEAAFCYEYLKRRGYDIPCFIEVDHPCNGMTATELGLAQYKK